jgi:Eco57I restriction-modification methylase
MTALPSDLRKLLEKAIVQARQVAEDGARKALDSLAIGRHEPHASMSPEDRSLRKRLRAHGRQLGDERDKQKGTQTTRRLEREVAYEHWHRMLFARFLSENGLLIEPKSKVAVTLYECKELAEEADTDPWELAASFAERMLPRIFRTDDPALEVTLPPETRNALHQLVADLPTDVFTSGDSLGWTYQFWQSAEKEAVNARGEKITGETLPAVTQLFTEPYMVQFLLHNTIGAWHAGKLLAERPEIAKNARSEQELRDAVALDGYAFDYLRFVRAPLEGEDPNAGTGPWRPAAGTYDGWPKQASELTVLDPCCGSGHFLVAAFDLLVHLRRAEEGTEVEDAIGSVLKDNLFGLELDARCTQIAAFHLALAAWRMAQAPIDLPPLSIACSGLGPNSTKEEWLELAESAAARGGMPSDRDLYKKEESLLSEPVRRGLEQLYETFESAPELGSLIDPAAQASDLLVAGFEQIAPLLDDILAADDVDAAQHERAVAASGMARAAKILVGPKGGYTLVLTNVPYLGRGSQSELLKDFADEHYKDAKADLATIFVARMLRWIRRGTSTESVGTIAAVTPQNWLFLTSYKKLRQRLLENRSWDIVVRLGEHAFESSAAAGAFAALLTISGNKPSESHLMAGIDVSAHRGQPPILAAAKATLLRGPNALHPHITTTHLDVGESRVRLLRQWGQMTNPDFRVSVHGAKTGSLLSARCSSFTGLGTGDFARLGRRFWELHYVSQSYALYQGPVGETTPWGGNEFIVAWDQKSDRVLGLSQAERDRIHNQDQSGQQAWGKRGVAVSLMGTLRSTLYTGAKYDKATAVLVPESEDDLSAVWVFASSTEFQNAVREVDSNVMCSNGALVKIRFDASHWRDVAERVYPDGLPDPFSDNPTQWLFHGHPSQSHPHAILQVAVARLVGYRWPTELDEEMRLAPEARALVQRCAELAEHADDDGIVCLPSIQGEGSASDRLRSLLASAFGTSWSASKEEDLLRAAGEHFHKGTVQRSLDIWLRDRFFEEHCALFHKRPFVWHVWDGLPDGFHALVNYHRLAGPDSEGKRTLLKLTSTYLGEWIERQRQELAAKEEGAEARLDAATALQDELRKIQKGEPPYDLFVRWKPLHEQPLGWDPDINDGVRLNIRPFLMAKDVGKKNAGILRAKPDNTWSNKKKPGVKDRGKEPQNIRPRLQFPWFWGCDPEEHTEHRTDFGSGLPDTAPASDTFDGQRWNNLHYTRGAKEAARRSREDSK